MVAEEAASGMFDALDRMVLEIQAMDAICNAEAEESDGEKGFVVVAQKALEQAQRCLDQADASDAPSQIDIEAFVSAEAYCEEISNDGVRLRISLPIGYPTFYSASVTVLHTPKFVTRSNHDELSSKLQATATELKGSEAMMSIITECRNVVSDWECNSSDIDATPLETKDNDTASSPIHPANVSHRWMWVHHITNNDRRKQIVIEAQDRNLGGFLKAGYPGVVCVEGDSDACDDFVVWIKGNKSRPGGFGRNWGHHVRGEATAEQRQLPEAFEELEDDMGILGTLCRESNVEDEFREFILQQK